MKFRRLSAVLILIIALFSTAEAGIFSNMFSKKKDTEESKTLKIWGFTDELTVVIDDFKADHPDINVEFSIIPSEEYPTKLFPVLRTGIGAPDIFLGEMSAVKKMVRSGYWEDLNKIAPEKIKKYESQTPKYVVDIAKDKNDIIRAVSWQATPGGFFYRRSLAKKYLGTDNPEEVAKLISTPEGFLNVGRKLRDLSNGQVKLLTGFADYEWIAKSARKEGWVNEKNELVIDPAIDNYFDVSKTLRNENLTAKVDQWTPAWFSNMNQDNVFGYLLPTWGYYLVLVKNAEDTIGDWAVAKAPSSYYWGGTWIGIYNKSKHKELAFEFIDKLTIQDEYMEKYARKTGDFMSNLKIDEILAGEKGGDFLAGQNHYDFFMKEAKNITPGLETEYDLDINIMMNSAVKLFLDGATKEEAFKSFKEEVANSFPNLIIK